jgi:hypothetical protein
MKMVYLNQVYDIFTLINHLIPQKNGKYENYGCTGVANMDADRKNLGSPVDEVDRAINGWKKCIQCAQNHYRLFYINYGYNEAANFCGKKNIFGF